MEPKRLRIHEKPKGKCYRCASDNDGLELIPFRGMGLCAQCAKTELEREPQIFMQGDQLFRIELKLDAPILNNAACARQFGLDLADKLFEDMPIEKIEAYLTFLIAHYQALKELHKQYGLSKMRLTPEERERFKESVKRIEKKKQDRELTPHAKKIKKAKENIRKYGVDPKVLLEALAAKQSEEK